MRRLYPAEIVVLGIVVTLLLIAAAQSQEHHAQHHAFYQGWVNKQDKGCCNDQDCGALRPENERLTSAGIEVRIDGEWCPVEPFHYLKRGNAPDWSTAHVCVVTNPTIPACQRLLCYQPKPGI